MLVSAGQSAITSDPATRENENKVQAHHEQCWRQPIGSHGSAGREGRVAMLSVRWQSSDGHARRSQNEAQSR